jgi:hypothetical protein
MRNAIDRVVAVRVSDRDGSLVGTRRTMAQRTPAASRTASVSDRDGSAVGTISRQHAPYR